MRSYQAFWNKNKSSSIPSDSLRKIDLLAQALSNNGHVVDVWETNDDGSFVIKVWKDGKASGV